MATTASEKADLANAENGYNQEHPPGNQQNAPWPADETRRRLLFPKKNLLVAYLLWFPFGILGFHRLYLHHNFMGFVYMFTLGYGGIGWLVDGFCLPSMVKERNEWLEHVATHPEEVGLTYGCWDVGCRYGHGIVYYRSLRDAYILTLNPLGILGFQHHYLGRPWYRLAYPLTAGLIGIGWITDMFRMPSLVKQTNAEIKLVIGGMNSEELRRHKIMDCNKTQAYLFALPGPGILGFHHFYLGRTKIGLVYFFTLGLFGIGWLVDLCRLPCLVKRSNKERKEMQMKHLDDAYLFYFPLGILGFHHFYLNRPCWGLIYFFTAGLFGIGWLIDLCRMPSLVKAANLRIKQSVAIITTAQQTYVIPADANVYTFGPNSQTGYPSNPVYPSAPDQQYPQHHLPPQLYPAMPPPQHNPAMPPQHYPPMPPPQYTQNPAQIPGVGGYQAIEQPPAYTPAATNEEQPTDELKQYPPP